MRYDILVKTRRLGDLKELLTNNFNLLKQKA